MGVTSRGKIFKSVVYYDSKWFTKAVNKLIVNRFMVGLRQAEKLCSVEHLVESVV